MISCISTPNNLLFSPQEKELKLKKIFEKLNYLFCVINPDGTLQTINQAWQNILGWTEKELAGQPWSYLIHKDERSAILAKLKGSELPRKIILETRYLHRDGCYLWLSWHLFPHEDRLIYAFARDITDEKKSVVSQTIGQQGQQKLGTSRLEREICPIFVAAIDKSGQLVYSNTPKSIGVSFVEAVHPCDRLTTQEKLEKLLNSREDNGFAGKPISFVNRYLTGDGSYKFLSWKATFLPKNQVIYATGHQINVPSPSEEKLIEHLQEILDRAKVQALQKPNRKEVEKWLSDRAAHPAAHPAANYEVDRESELATVKAELAKVKAELQQEITQRQQAQTNLTQIFHLSRPDDPWSCP
jgi:PAS domain S-box-containing protein